ncbi:MAG: transcription termination/antitermination factor NusG [Bacteroidales bacterium]|nr:transcription termination/antitermination factor NusG [Bacteroidales bacterium]MBR5715458.1 transcription termination/antitermination factor NusG [Bacteroidales bacterium]
MAVEYRWYCLRAISGKELKVKELLEAEIKNGDFNGNVEQVIVPTEKVVVQKGNKKDIKEKVLFSGYVFVRCKLVGEVQAQLANTTNVVNFLMGRVTKKPEPLPDDQIAAMLGNVDDRIDAQEAAQVTFMVGETIKVNDGPFKDFDGVIEEISDEKKKLKVSVKIFGRKTPLELNFDQVIKEA